MILPPEHYDWFDSLCRSLGIVDTNEAIKSGGFQFEGDLPRRQNRCRVT